MQLIWKPLYYIYFFIAAVLVLIVLLYGSNAYHSKKMLLDIFDSSRNEFTNKIETFKVFEENAKRYIDAITVNETFLDYISSDGKTEQKYSENLYLSLAKTAPEIMQLRYIDEIGKEKIRVDRKNLNTPPAIIKHDALQDKGDRDYFEQTAILAKGTYWTSRLNLNIEHGKVEIPYKPTLRVSTPLYVSNTFKGIVIINLFMKDELEKLADSEIYDNYIVDDRGIFLIHPNTEKNYGAYLGKPYKLKYDLQNLDLDDTHLRTYKDESIMMKTLLSNSSETLKLIIKPKESVLEKSHKTAWQWSLLTSFILASITFPLLYLFVARNIRRINTHLTKQNTQLKTILQQTDEAIFQSDINGKITLTNHSASVIFKVSEFEIITKNLFEYIMLPEYNTTKEDMLNRTNISFKTAGRRSDGEVFPLNVFIQKSTINTQEIFLIFARDLTGEQENEQIIIQQSKRVAMGDMLAAITHQWRQPLTSLGFVIQYLEAAHKEGKCDEALMEETTTNANQLITFMSNTIDEFKNFTQTSNQSQFFEIETVIRFVIKMTEPQLQKEGIFLHFSDHLDPATKIQVNGSASELQQVLINLIHNAQEAVAWHKVKGDKIVPKIDIIIDRVDNDMLSLQVIDNNGGIDKAIILNIFNPFFSTKGDKGTGLGLYICKLIIENRFHGSITVDNTDEGARFSMRIPIAGSKRES